MLPCFLCVVCMCVCVLAGSLAVYACAFMVMPLQTHWSFYPWVRLKWVTLDTGHWQLVLLSEQCHLARFQCSLHLLSWIKWWFCQKSNLPPPQSPNAVSNLFRLNNKRIWSLFYFYKNEPKVCQNFGNFSRAEKSAYVYFLYNTV